MGALAPLRRAARTRIVDRGGVVGRRRRRPVHASGTRRPSVRPWSGPCWPPSPCATAPAQGGGASRAGVDTGIVVIEGTAPAASASGELTGVAGGAAAGGDAPLRASAGPGCSSDRRRRPASATSSN